MTLDVVMFHAAHERVADRLAALDLPLRVLPLRADGSCTVDGAQVPLAEVRAEAVWLSLEIPQSGLFDDCMAAITASDSVKWLQTFNAGLDHPGYREIAAKGVRIGASNAQAVAIAEYTLAHVLEVFQPLAEQRAAQAAGTWKLLRFREIAGTSWLIVGYGSIGQEVGKRAEAFGARVLGVRRTARPAPHADRVVAMGDVASVLGEADVVVLSCPHTRETDRLVDAGFLAACKAGVVLVNVARGGVIDDSALLAALDSGKVASAILDVFEPEPLPEGDPYWVHPKVRLTGHCSFAGDGTLRRGDELFLANLPLYAAGETLVNEVDLAVFLETLR